MTALKLATKLRAYTRQTSMTLTDATALLLLNDAKNELADRIVNRDIKGNYFVLPTLTDLVASQREYPLPSDMLSHIYSIEVAFSQAVGGVLAYVLALPDDFRRFGLGRTEANITANYTNGGALGLWPDNFGFSRTQNVGPCYEIQRRAIYLLSGAIDSTTLGGSTVPNGIRIRYRAYPADLTALADDITDLSIDPSTTTFGVPKQVHELWARRASIDWKSQHPGAVPMSSLEQKYDVDLESELDSLFMADMSDEIRGVVQYDDGQNY